MVKSFSVSEKTFDQILKIKDAKGWTQAEVIREAVDHYSAIHKLEDSLNEAMQRDLPEKEVGATEIF